MSSGRGRVVAGTNPAANAEVSDAVPAGKWWDLIAVTVSCAQGATQTPLPMLVVTDADGVTYFGVNGASSAQNSAVTCRYNWGRGSSLTAGGAATTAYAPLPSGIILKPGDLITTVTAGKGANTDYGAPSYVVVEYDFDPRL